MWRFGRMLPYQDGRTTNERTRKDRATHPAMDHGRLRWAIIKSVLQEDPISSVWCTTPVEKQNLNHIHPLRLNQPNHSIFMPRWDILKILTFHSVAIFSFFRGLDVQNFEKECFHKSSLLPVAILSFIGFLESKSILHLWKDRPPWLEHESVCSLTFWRQNQLPCNWELQISCRWVKQILV